MRQPASRLVAIVASIVVGGTLSAPACATAAQAVQASHIRMVYPDAPEVSNAGFPPIQQDAKTVRDELRTIAVVSKGHHMSLGQYLRSEGVTLSKVVSIKVHGTSAAVYAYRN
jgi:hypothetical protein